MAEQGQGADYWEWEVAAGEGRSDVRAVASVEQFLEAAKLHQYAADFLPKVQGSERGSEGLRALKLMPEADLEAKMLSWKPVHRKRCIRLRKSLGPKMPILGEEIGQGGFGSVHRKAPLRYISSARNPSTGLLT